MSSNERPRVRLPPSITVQAASSSSSGGGGGAGGAGGGDGRRSATGSSESGARARLRGSGSGRHSLRGSGDARGDEQSDFLTSLAEHHSSARSTRSEEQSAAKLRERLDARHAQLRRLMLDELRSHAFAGATGTLADEALALSDALHSESQADERRAVRTALDLPTHSDDGAASASVERRLAQSGQLPPAALTIAMARHASRGNSSSSSDSSTSSRNGSMSGASADFGGLRASEAEDEAAAVIDGYAMEAGRDARARDEEDEDFDAPVEQTLADKLSPEAQELEYQLGAAETTVRALDASVAEQQLLDAVREEQAREEQARELLRRAETRAERFARAAKYVRAALNGRRVVNGSGKLFEGAFFFQTHRFARLVPMFVNTLHVLFVFAEPPSASLARDTDRYPLAYQRGWLGAELLCCAVYAFYLATRIAYYGWPSFRRRWFNLLNVCTTALMFVDVCVAFALGPGAVRFSRPFRPLLLISNSARLRQLLVAALRTMPHIFDVFFISILIMVVYAAIGIQLYGGVYRSSPDGPAFDDNFDSFPRAFIALVVLTTTENYPDVMYPALRLSSWNALFFVSYLLLNSFLMMSVVVAVSFDRFLKENRRGLVRRRRLQRRGLLAAFAALDHDGTAEITFDDWFALQQQLEGSKVDRRRARAVFDALDQDRTGRLDVLEFFRLTDVINLRFYKLPAAREMYRGNRSLLARWHARVRRLVHSRRFNAASFACIVLSTIVVCLLVALPLTVVGERTVFALGVADSVLTGLFVLEVLLRLTALGFRQFFADGWLRFDAFVAALSCALPILEAARPESPDARFSLTLRLFRLGRLSKAVRLLGAARRFRVITSTYAHLLPAMMRIGALLLALFAAYGVVGMELFAGTDMVLYSDGYNTFDTPWNAALTIFQLFSTSNWHEIMYAAINATSAWAAVYFISFHWIVIEVILNLLLAMLLETFSMALENYDQPKSLVLEPTAVRKQHERERQQRERSEQHKAARRAQKAARSEFQRGVQRSKMERERAEQGVEMQVTRSQAAAAAAAAANGSGGGARLRRALPTAVAETQALAAAAAAKTASGLISSSDDDDDDDDDDDEYESKSGKSNKGDEDDATGSAWVVERKRQLSMDELFLGTESPETLEVLRDNRLAREAGLNKKQVRSFQLRARKRLEERDNDYRLGSIIYHNK